MSGWDLNSNLANKPRPWDMNETYKVIATVIGLVAFVAYCICR